MELVNTFHVDADPATAWAVLTDLARIAPCLPGAALDGHDGDEYSGAVSVKIGPISASYAGTARFLAREAPTRARLRADGRETRGQGGAGATIDATLAPAAGGGTEVRLVTDLQVSGRIAAFGRGMFEEVSEKLLGQFVANLGVVMAEPRGETDTDTDTVTTATPGTAPIRAGSLLAGPLLRRLLPAALAAGVALVLIRWLRRRPPTVR